MQFKLKPRARRNPLMEFHIRKRMRETGKSRSEVEAAIKAAVERTRLAAARLTVSRAKP